MIRPTWVEIDLGAIRRNVQRLVALGKNKQVDIIAVVKANGYGHGAFQVGKEALNAGASALAVALPEEGIALRKAGITAPILVMGAFVPGSGAKYMHYDLTATLTHPDQADAFVNETSGKGRRQKVHLKVDTGMGRLGVLPHDIEALVKRVIDAGHIEVEGIFSHLATAEEECKGYAINQLAAFEDVLRHLKTLGIRPSQRHILNSAGLLHHAPGSTNVARVGLAIYGIHPAEHLRSTIELEPAMTFYTRVVAVKNVPAGTSVSYGCRYQTDSHTTLAALPVGYADGLSRRLSHHTSVNIRGARFPIVGSICMDQAIVDVGSATIEVGDEVILFGGGSDGAPQPQEWAKTLDTIVYEILTMISARVPRRYVNAFDGLEEI